MKAHKVLLILIASLNLIACAPSSSPESTVAAAEIAENAYYHYQDQGSTILVYKAKFTDAMNFNIVVATVNKSTGVATSNPSDQICVPYSLYMDDIMEITVAGFNGGARTLIDTQDNDANAYSAGASDPDVFAYPATKDNAHKAYINSLSITGLVACP